jgi:hypothetical protein
MPKTTFNLKKLKKSIFIEVSQPINPLSKIFFYLKIYQNIYFKFFNINMLKNIKILKKINLK